MTSIAGMDFGFPVVAHPTRPGTAYLLPLLSDEYRCTPGRPLHGVAHDRRRRGVGAADRRAPAGARPPHRAPRWLHHRRLRSPAGLYFGTRTGELYGSLDDGDSWQCLADHLPPVMSVRAAAIG